MATPLEDLIDEVLAFLWSASPTGATAAGIHDHDHRLADCDPAAIDERAARLARYRARLAALLDGVVTGDERLDGRVLAGALHVEERQLRDIRAPFRDPSYYLDEILYGVYYLVQRDFAPVEERARVATRRLEEVPRLLREATANLSRPGEIPSAWVSAALQELAGSLLFLGDLEHEFAPRAGSAGEDLCRALRAAREALDRFGRHVREQVAPRAAGSFAVGRDLFEFLLRTQHGIEQGADDLHHFGQDLIRATQEQLEASARAIDPARSWQESVALWKKDHPPRGRFVEEYRRESDRARAFVVERALATLPPGEILHVVETPSFQRSMCPFAAYLPPGPFEAQQEGFLWVTPPPQDAAPEAVERLLMDHPRAAISGTMAHEAYPGHHLQLTRSNRIASKVARSFATSVFIEGWAFYCEQMMAEEGFLLDPRSAVLQLKDQLWRSCRVVIDVGMHTRGLDMESAVAMLHDVARIELPSARGEVLRYTRSPTQPLSYAVGKREIIRLRDDCRQARGDAFTLRRFHDELLGFGSIPIAFMRERMLGGTGGSG